jgi:hypothetical protein
VTTREERLSALEDAVNEWAETEQTRLQDEAKFLRSVLSGRTNGGRVATYVTERASALLEDEIKAFLEE